MQKWNIANKIQETYDFASLIKQLEQLDRPECIRLERKKVAINKSPGVCKVAILDFEGSPIFCCGLLIYKTIYTYYIENYGDKLAFYTFIFRLLQIAKDLSFFTFSDHERVELLRMYQYLRVQGEDVSEFNFLSSLPIINLQKPESKYESLTEAFYSIHPHSIAMTGDTLFRNNKLIDKLFAAQKFDEIIQHNQNCLENEYLIFLVRWYKNYKI